MLHYDAAMRRERRQRRHTIIDNAAAAHGGDFAKQLMQQLQD